MTTSTATGEPDLGSLRETLFCRMLSSMHHLTSEEKADFLVDGKLTVEVGGKNKGADQIIGTKKSLPKRTSGGFRSPDSPLALRLSVLMRLPSSSPALSAFQVSTPKNSSDFYLPVSPDQASKPANAGSDHLRYDLDALPATFCLKASPSVL